MSRTKIIILSVAVAFFIIAVHQTITLGFEYSYWLFMIPISLILIIRLIDQRETKHKNKQKTIPENKRNKKEKHQMNRSAKRYIERMK